VGRGPADRRTNSVVALRACVRVPEARSVGNDPVGGRGVISCLWVKGVLGMREGGADGRDGSGFSAGGATRLSGYRMVVRAEAGATFVGGFSHDFDLVGSVVGMNTLNPIKTIGSIRRSPTLMMALRWSPHSMYLYSEIK